MAKATAELTESFQRPLEGSKEAPSQSLKKDWRNLSMDDFRQRHGEGAALNRHFSIGVLKYVAQHGQMQQIVADGWNEFWQRDKDYSFDDEWDQILSQFHSLHDCPSCPFQAFDETT